MSSTSPTRKKVVSESKTKAPASPKKKTVARAKKKASSAPKKRGAVKTKKKAAAAPKKKTAAAPKAQEPVVRGRRRLVKRPPHEPRILQAEIREIYWGYADDEVAKKYEIGKRLERSDGDPIKYGAKFIEGVAADLDLSDKTLYRWRDVAKRFPEDKFQEIRDRAAKQDKRLKWNHFESFASVRDPGARLRIVNQVIDEDFNTSQTADLVNEFLNPQSSKRTGLPKPRSAAAGLRTMQLLGTQFLELCACYEECVISDIAANDVQDPDDIAKLEAIQELLEKVVEAGSKTRDSVVGLLSNIKKLEEEEAEREEREKEKRELVVEYDEDELFAS